MKYTICFLLLISFNAFAEKNWLTKDAYIETVRNIPATRSVSVVAVGECSEIKSDDNYDFNSEIMLPLTHKYTDGIFDKVRTCKKIAWNKTNCTEWKYVNFRSKGSVISTIDAFSRQVTETPRSAPDRHRNIMSAQLLECNQSRAVLIQENRDNLKTHAVRTVRQGSPAVKIQ